MFNYIKNNKIYIIIFLIIIFVSIKLFYEKFIKNNNKIIKKNFNSIKWADDVTKLNKTRVDRIYYVLCDDDIKKIIKLANEKNKKIIARGEKHSMGGQTIINDGYIIDTKFMNHILEVDIDNKNVTVEPGVTWSDLINFLNNYGLSPMTLQSYASFSIGGSISVNIHGITNDYGVYKSVIEFEIINWEGKKIKCSRVINSELFSLVLGGYGLFGIICKIKLRIVNNVKIFDDMIKTNANDFRNVYEPLINDEYINIKFARINITDMHSINLYVLRNLNDNSVNSVNSVLDDNPKEMSKLSQILYKWIIPNKSIQKLRFDLEKKNGKPLDVSDDCDTRNKLLFESAKPISELYSPIFDFNKTHILQEYFIPPKNFCKWIDYLKIVFIKNDYQYINLLNITIRFVKKDKDTFLKYARKDMYAFVLYYRIDCSTVADTELSYIHNLLLDKAIELNGSFYLPYRQHYTFDQLIKAYPNIIEFFNLKNKYDPKNLFSNLWYQKYKNILEKTNDNYKCNYNDNSLNIIYAHESIITTPEFLIDNNFYRVLFNNSNNHNSKKFQLFLKYIFPIIPNDKLYKFVKKLLHKKQELNDIQVFNIVSKYVKEKTSSINLYLTKSSLLNKQREIISDIIKDIFAQLEINYTLDGILYIGDSRTYLKSIKEKCNISNNTNNIYILNNESNYIEQESFIFVDKFIQYDFNFVKNIPLPNNNVDVITCLIGLHHFTDFNIIPFLKNIYKILKPNGFFILREHNGHNDLLPLLNCVHNVLNAGMGKNISTEINEIRNFKKLIEWRKLIESVGFKDTMVYNLQENDPTENFFMCFIKK